MVLNRLLVCMVVDARVRLALLLLSTDTIAGLIVEVGMFPHHVL
jgi:hypothetical protein